MYESHWGLSALPFENRNASDFYYPSESHQAALLKMLYAIEARRSAVLLCGDSGSGKSMLMEIGIAQLPEAISPVIRVPYPAMPSDSLIRYLARQASPDEPWGPRTDLSDSIDSLERFLATNAREGRHALVVIEEAHLLEGAGALQPIRMLLNLATEHSQHESTWTLCLVGGIPLLGHLARHTELEDRIAARCILDRLELDSTAAYLEHRLRSAGHSGTSPFTEEALAAIQDYSSGIPRRINRICDMALMIGYAQELSQIDAAVIRLAQQEIAYRISAAA
jgi:general secretion pathway protein A